MDAVIGYQAAADAGFLKRLQVSALLLCLAAGFAGAWIYWPVALAPLVFGVICICIFKPDWGLYFLVAALFFPYAIVSEPTFYAADIILFLVVIGVWLRRVREGKLGLTRTPMDWPIAVWLGIMALSLVNAYDVTRGIVNWLRHVQLVLLLYTICIATRQGHAQKAIAVLLGIAVVFSTINLIPFIMSGGVERIYGIPRVSFNGILALSLVYLSARICFETNLRRTTILIGATVLIGLGLTATQSRAAIGAAGAGMLLMVSIAWCWGRLHNVALPSRRALQFIAAGLVLGVAGLILIAPFFQITLNRFQAVGSASVTLNYRYFLWKTALAGYLSHPVLGIGLGQVQVWQNILPNLRLQPLGWLTFGLGTHLSFLKYLVETGTIGAMALLWFLFRLGRLATSVIRRTMTLNQAGHRIGVSGVVFTLILRVFLEGNFFYATAGIMEALFIGFLMGSHHDDTGNQSTPRAA